MTTQEKRDYFIRLLALLPDEEIESIFDAWPDKDDILSCHEIHRIPNQKFKTDPFDFLSVIKPREPRFPFRGVPWPHTKSIVE